MAECYLQFGINETTFPGDVIPNILPMHFLIPDTHEHLFRFMDYDLYSLEEPLKEYLSILDGGISASGWGNVKSDSISRMYFEALAKKYHFKLDEPIKNLSDEVINVILYGTKGDKLTLHYEQARGRGTLTQPFEGIANNLQRRYRETQSPAMRTEIEECMAEQRCPDCAGNRLKREVLAVTVGGLNIADFTKLSVLDELAFLDHLELSEKDALIAGSILKEIKSRLHFLVSVGLQYLSLSRASGTLSGGESQRIRLATQIGSALMGVLYILDEPTTGLHTADVHKLLQVLQRLVDSGNTVVVIEHNLDVIKCGDYIVDMGPEGGDGGGTVVASGTPEEVAKNKKSYTGMYIAKMLSRKKFK